MSSQGKSSKWFQMVAELDKLVAGPKIIWIFLALIIPSCLFLTVATPPFQTPDAPNHFYKAYQVSQGVLFGRHVKGSNGSNISGGYIDSGIAEFANIVYPIKFRPDQKWTQSQANTAVNARLSGNKIPLDFSNTAPYSFLGYLPQAMAFWVAGHGHASIWKIYRFSCAINALCAIVITALALRLARRSRAVIFTLALLPESVSLMSSVSQDGTLIPLSFFLIAWLDRLIYLKSPISRRTAVGLSLLVIAIATARIPYIAFVLCFFHPAVRITPVGGRYDLATRCTWLGVTFLAVVCLYQLQTYLANGGLVQAGAMGAQSRYLLENWTVVPHLMQQTLLVLGKWYAISFIGVLGWLDTYMSAAYYYKGMAVIAIAVLYCALQPPPFMLTLGARFQYLWSWLPVLASSALIFLGLYLQWSKVGATLIDGVQGRYFLPVFPLVALGVPPLCKSASSWFVGLTNLRALFAICILFFPILSFFMTIEVVLDRYYVG